jgi:hypothetical protein
MRRVELFVSAADKWPTDSSIEGGLMTARIGNGRSRFLRFGAE